jgi:hypothetical protein
MTFIVQLYDKLQFTNSVFTSRKERNISGSHLNSKHSQKKKLYGDCLGEDFICRFGSKNLAKDN